MAPVLKAGRGLELRPLNLRDAKTLFPLVEANRERLLRWLPWERSQRVLEAVQLLDQRRVDFEYDGEMAADVALNMELREAYPFCRLSGPANVLIMPAFHSASISTKLLRELGGATVIGPMLVGLDRSVQIVPLSANDAQIVNMAALAGYNVSG